MYKGHFFATLGCCIPRLHTLLMDNVDVTANGQTAGDLTIMYEPVISIHHQIP